MPTADRPPAPASPLQERRRRIEILRELSRRPRNYSPPARAGGKTAVIWSSAMKAVAGAWLLVSPILIGYDTAVWNVMTFGAVLVLLVFARIEAHAPARLLYAAQGMVGIWLVLSAFWLH